MEYVYFLTGRSGTRQVHPINNGSLEKTYEKKSNRSELIRKMKGTIVLIGQDFKWLYHQELLVYRFEPLTIKIHKYCDGKWQENWFEGIIYLNSGEWDLDRFRVEFPIEIADKYACYESGKDTVLNLLNTVYPKVDMNPVVGTVESRSFWGRENENETWEEFPGEPNPKSIGWVKLKYSFRSDNNGDGGMISRSSMNSGYHEVTWVREVLYDNGDELETQGWINIGRDNYARAPILYNYQPDAPNNYRPNDWGYSYDILQKPIDNGMLLKQIFEQFLSSICPGLILVSDFFQWNPENPSNINYVTQTLNKYTNLLVFQKSDVKNPYATGNAGFDQDAKSSELKFSDLLEDICNIFQLEWEITDDGKFKIEHVSYKSRHNGLDTTRGNITARLNNGRRQYSYDNDGIPKKEVFLFMDDTSSGDFKAAPIIYTNPIAGKEKDEEKYIIKNFTTDVMLCLANPSADSKVVSKEGFVLMACSPMMSVLRDKSIRGNETVNNPLAWSQLHRDFWRHNRFMLNFKMNEIDSLALSVKPIKVQESIKYLLCCESEFDTEGLIKTGLGDNGILESATFRFNNNIIEMKVAFPAEGKLEENRPPVAVNDETETFMNTPVIIDVLANDIDTDGLIIPSSLIINSVWPGTADITDDFKVRYTPTTGFTGEGRLYYNVKDNFGETSNNAVVSIIVKGGSSLPVANGNSFLIAKNLQLRPGAGSIQKNDTAATPITVVSESKSSTQDGTVSIESNGNFTYLAALDFIGEDTFEYTIEDNFNNEATGTIAITVFEPETIYVSLDQVDDRREITRNCSDGMIAIGRETGSEITIKFWADSAGTIPFTDVKGYNLIIRILQKRTDYNNSSGSYEYPMNINFNEGNEYLLFNDFVTERTFSGCSSSDRENYKVDFSIEPDSKYVII